MFSETDQTTGIFTQLKSYLYKVRWTIVLIAGMTFLTHGSILFSQRFGVDTDIALQNAYQFESVGRQGLQWLLHLFGMEHFSLYHAQILTILFMTFAPVAFGFLFYQVGHQTRLTCLSLFLFSLAFVISPFWVTQIYFLNQSAQVLFSCILIPVTVLLAEKARGHFTQKWYYILAVLALMQVIFASYQVLVVMYVVTVVTVFLLSIRKEQRSFRQMLQWIGFHVALFFAGFLGYTMVSKLFYMSESSYLSNQILWSQLGLEEGLRNCYATIRQSFLNQPPYYTGFYGLFIIICLVLTFLSIRQAGLLKKLSGITAILSVLFLAGSPYLLVFFYGGIIVDRMQLIMPLSQGILLYLILLFLPEKKIEKNRFTTLISGIVCLLFLLAVCRDSLLHLNYCSRLYYTDEFVFQYELKIADKMYQDITGLQEHHEKDVFYDNIVILGTPDIPYNNTCITGHTIGLSFFQFRIPGDIGHQRLHYFMQNTGCPLDIYFSPGESDAFHAYFEEYFSSDVDAMPSYPSPGYAQYIKNDEIGLEYLVVKLGPDWRFTN